jgi:hypothetical protein
MENFDFAFKSLAILHTIAGCLLFGLAANEEIQQSCFYKDRNPLIGDIQNYIAYAGCWSLIICGIVAFFMPKLAVIAALTSIAFYLLSGVLPVVVEHRLPPFCKACAISLGIRVIAAVALIALFRHVAHG